MGGLNTPPSLFGQKAMGPGTVREKLERGSRDGPGPLSRDGPGPRSRDGPGDGPGPRLQMSLGPQIKVLRVPGRSGRVPGRSWETGRGLSQMGLEFQINVKNCCRNIPLKKSPKSSNSPDRPRTVPGRSENANDQNTMRILQLQFRVSPDRPQTQGGG